MKMIMHHPPPHLELLGQLALRLLHHLPNQPVRSVPVLHKSPRFLGIWRVRLVLSHSLNHPVFEQVWGVVLNLGLEIPLRLLPETVHQVVAVPGDVQLADPGVHHVERSLEGFLILLLYLVLLLLPGHLHQPDANHLRPPSRLLLLGLVLLVGDVLNQGQPLDPVGNVQVLASPGQVCSSQVQPIVFVVEHATDPLVRSRCDRVPQTSGWLDEKRSRPNLWKLFLVLKPLSAYKFVYVHPC